MHLLCTSKLKKKKKASALCPLNNNAHRTYMSQWIKSSNVATGEILLETMRVESCSKLPFTDYVKDNIWPHLQTHDFPNEPRSASFLLILQPVSNSQSCGLTFAMTLTFPTTGIRHWIQEKGGIFLTTKTALSLFSLLSWAQMALSQDPCHNQLCCHQPYQSRGGLCPVTSLFAKQRPGWQGPCKLPSQLKPSPPTTAVTHQTFPGHRPLPGFSPCQ